MIQCPEDIHGGASLSSTVFFVYVSFYGIRMKYTLKAAMTTRLKMLYNRTRKSPTTTFFRVLNYLVYFHYSVSSFYSWFVVYQTQRACFTYAEVTQCPAAATQQWLYLHGQSNSTIGHVVNKVSFGVNG